MLDHRQIGRLLESVATVPIEYLQHLLGGDARGGGETQFAVLQPGEHRDQEQQPNRHLVEGLLQEPDCRQPTDDARAVEGICGGGDPMAEQSLDKGVDAYVAVVLVQVTVDEPRR